MSSRIFRFIAILNLRIRASFQIQFSESHSNITFVYGAMTVNLSAPFASVMVNSVGVGPFARHGYSFVYGFPDIQSIDGAGISTAQDYIASVYTDGFASLTFVPSPGNAAALSAGIAPRTVSIHLFIHICRNCGGDSADS